MGLTLCAEGCEIKCHFSYSGFYNFRKSIAKSLGFELERMEGYSLKHPINEEYIMLGNISWNNIKSPLKYFLNHSDSEGCLSAKNCEIILPQLKVIIFQWEDFFHHDNKYLGGQLIALMDYCASSDKDLIFS